MPPLTEMKLRAIRPDGTITRFYDQMGLYLEVSKAGRKSWRFKYRFAGKEKRLTLGAWPEVSLKEARARRDEARAKLRQGNDPAPGKEAGGLFQEVAQAWSANMGHVWSASHAATVQGRLARDVYPALGRRPVRLITPQEVLVMLRAIEARQAFETAHRVLGMCSMIFRYAVAVGLVDSDPCRDLRGALVPYQKGQFAALTTPCEAGALMRSIEGYRGSGVVRAALVFSALTFCRPGEIRQAEWKEVDFDRREWIIPAEKMKMRQAHRVPLSRQALEVLVNIRPLTGDGRYVFPGMRGRGRPLSENAVNAALRSMGYAKEQMTAHGFRAMASTLLNELGHRADVIEAQLAHKGADKIRAIYNRAEYMDARRRLMQAWADYLDALREGAPEGRADQTSTISW